MKPINSNITKLYAFSFLQMTLFPMAIITLFWKDHIGLSLTQILLLQGILSVVMVVMEYPSGYISDRIGYRVSLNLAALLGMAGWGIYTVAGTFAHVMAAEILIGISLAFISGSDSALLYETLKQAGAEQQYARHQGRMGGYAQGGEALGAVFAGVLYAYAPLLPFFLQVGVWFLAFLVTRSLVEPPRDVAPHAGHLKEALRTARYAFVENRGLRYTILLNSVLGIASFYPVWLIQPYMQHAGVPLTWFGPVWSGANLTVAFFSLTSHRVSTFLGERFMLLLFLLLIVVGYLGLGTVGGMCGFLFYYLLTAMRGLKERATIEADLRKSARLYPMVTKLFIADGDALIMPMAEWRWLMPAIREHLPWVERIGVYATGLAIRKKTTEDLAWLRDNRLGIIYLGVESGDPLTLDHIRKDSTAEQLIEAGQKVKAAGIGLSVTVLLGIAPPGRSLDHGRLTGSLLTAMDPDYVGALSVIICAGTELEKQVRRGEHLVPAPLQLLDELREMLAHTELTAGLFMANHASNYLPLKVEMPRGKVEALALLEAAIRGEVHLRSESRRAL